VEELTRCREIDPASAETRCHRKRIVTATVVLQQREPSRRDLLGAGCSLSGIARTQIGCAARSSSAVSLAVRGCPRLRRATRQSVISATTPVAEVARFAGSPATQVRCRGSVDAASAPSPDRPALGDISRAASRSACAFRLAARDLGCAAAARLQRLGSITTGAGPLHGRPPGRASARECR
jgi:hypothetical protein